MIFVTVGTHSQPFDRLIGALAALEDCELVVQHGYARPPERATRAVPFMSFAETVEQLEAADAVVTHAGVGSILSARRAGHTPVVAPRLRRFGEHVDDHQVELTDALAARGMVVVAKELADLRALINSVPPREPREAPVESPFHQAVRDALQGRGKATPGAER